MRQLIPDLEKIILDYAREPPKGMQNFFALMRFYDLMVDPVYRDIFDSLGSYDWAHDSPVAHKLYHLWREDLNLQLLQRIGANVQPDSYAQKELLNAEFCHVLLSPDSPVNQETLSWRVFDHLSRSIWPGDILITIN